MMPFVTPKPDAIVAGRYRLVEELGAGSAGPLFRAERLADKHLVALRILRAPAGDRAMLRRFFEHARASSRVGALPARTLSARADHIAAADARGMAMVFTGMRHFRH